MTQARARSLFSDERFTVDSTLVEACASLKRLRRKDRRDATPPDDPGRAPKRVEEIFGWLRTVAPLRKLRYRGLLKARWLFIFATAIYNLIRIRNLSEATA